MRKEYFRTVHPVLIIAICITALNIHPAAVVEQSASGVLKITPVAPVQLPEQEIYPVDAKREKN